ncbi:NAD(P)/FAD-dependent oxidoreductase [Deinococcus maricopensis]|uniref:FAD dependent oxidoreductase n=1 Tax=Deinococcus maricopensis (strain DSM 21211 / LMG 22137 / NRRL B-23946 / LB-34) TaxID=709986 RepID=E8U806_DEIML|nr:FAD-dependent oxidoreductase [Deinococcus maricopensis]ADV67195.1 FAD dependent oxidoreductase [Deinococcus maricopensis DSM 21211]
MRALIIGAGVAGASVAYFAHAAGFEVTVVDAGVSAASRVPSALVNPVRGQSGRVDADAVSGMRLTWSLVEALIRAGFDIPHGREGIVRPVPDDRTRMKFERNLPLDLLHAWVDPAGVSGLAPGWAHALSLPEGGWLDGGAFTRALLGAAQARVVRARALGWSATSVTLSSGVALTGDTVVWCGGSVGATWAGLGGVHRGGSVLLTSAPLSPAPLSFGAYLTPAARGGAVGATFEAPTDTFQEAPIPASSRAWLDGKVQALTGSPPQNVVGTWTGSRLSGTLPFGRTPGGWWALCGLGSKGFLLGPLQARALVEALPRE